MHGGEYGSPGTWSFWAVGHAVGAEIGLPLAPVPPPLAVWPGTPVVSLLLLLSPPPLPPDDELLLSSFDALTDVALCGFDGTSSAIKMSMTVSTASGP